MSAHVYTEDLLIEQPAVELFADLDWITISAREEIFGPSGTLQRETSAEVVLETRLRSSLAKLNPLLPAEAITAAVDQLSRDRSAMLPAAANREVYELLKDGVQVSVPDRERGGQKTERVRVIDWNDSAGNDFLLVSQMTITGPLYTCRPDLIGFVNGLPLVVIELKKPGVSARAAFDENITSYKHPLNGIPALFWYNALIIASNGTESRVGTITANWERMAEWKRVEREDEPRRVSLEVMLRGVCEPARLLDLAEKFTLFSEHEAGLVKILGQNHRVLGVKCGGHSVVARASERLDQTRHRHTNPSPKGRGALSWRATVCRIGGASGSWTATNAGGRIRVGPREIVYPNGPRKANEQSAPFRSQPKSALPSGYAVGQPGEPIVQQAVAQFPSAPPETMASLPSGPTCEDAHRARRHNGS